MAKQPESFFDFDFTKFASDFKVPGIDLESMMSSQRRNFEALTAANRLAYEGLQSVVKRQVEIMRATVEEVAKATQTLTEAGSPQDKAAQQTELAKEAFEKALGNMRELSEMVARSNTEAFELLNKRYTQILDETRDLLVKAQKK